MTDAPDFVVEEVLSVGSHRRHRRRPHVPRSVQTALAAGAIAALVAVAVARPTSSGHSENTAAVTAIVTEVRGLAAAASLQDTLLPGTSPCPHPPRDLDPESVADHALTAALPGATPRDGALTLDQLGGLCEVVVRASYGTGTTLIARVVPAGQSAPTTPPDRTSQRDAVGATATVIAVVTTADGWAVTAAAVGPAAESPTTAVLLAIASQSALHW